MTSRGSGTNIKSRTWELIAKTLKVIDLVFELIDARCPVSTRSRLVKQMITGKQQLLILNKADLADPIATKKWLEYFRTAGIDAVAVNSRTGKGFREVRARLAQRAKDLNQKLSAKGRLERELRTAVFGIPNMGKSTFLNRMIGRRSAATGDRPGITRGPQWVHLKDSISMLDTPGILPFQVKKKDEVFKLVVIGAYEPPDLDAESISRGLMDLLETVYPGQIHDFLEIPRIGALTLEDLADHKRFLLSDGTPDLHRTAGYFLRSFKNGKLGPVTLEFPG